jgi:hypothetical protein
MSLPSVWNLGLGWTSSIHLLLVVFLLTTHNAQRVLEAVPQSPDTRNPYPK